jgi:molybdopterin converting factor small subunit
MATAAPSSISVRVLLFASYADLLGGDARELALPAPARVSDVVARLRALPGGERLPSRPLCALNLRHVGPEAALAEGDELALLPPLAGG